MKRERGHAMLELAVSAGVMVSCLVGTFQFGYTFYAYNQLVTAVGDGARYAAQRTYRAATDQDVERGNAAKHQFYAADRNSAPRLVCVFSPSRTAMRRALASSSSSDGRSRR